MHDTYVKEHNVITKDEYQAHATETLSIIKTTLAQSLGYYGSTSILEDNLRGNTVTKDGYTILNQIKFGPDDTISNTLLKMIKDISRSLVMEVGDGSTSAVVSSEALFTKLTADPEFKTKFAHVPAKVIIDKLAIISKKVKTELTKSATPITDDNFDRLKDIAAVSNNNDAASGTIIHDIYKEIGKGGFIVLEKGYGSTDTYEVSNGIETSYGFADSVFANRANGFEGDYADPAILVVNGQLDRDDITWVAAFMGAFWSKSPSVPLVFLTTGYDREFLNFLKINYKENNRTAGVQAAATSIAADKEEVLRDLATYLHAEVLDKADNDLYQAAIDPFLTNNPIEITSFLNESLGGAEQVYMNMNYTRFIEGTGDSAAITERVSQIEKEIAYLQENSAHRDTTPDIYKLQKRIGNLQGKIAKLYISGNSDTEVDARKYLFEDAIFASKSALEHGYVAGGNLAVSRILDDLYPKDYQADETDKYAEVEVALAGLVKDSFLNVYRTVLANANYDQGAIENIIRVCLTSDTLYDVKAEEYEDIAITPVINSVMTDIRIMESVFSIIGLLVTSNQYVQKMPRAIR